MKLLDFDEYRKTAEYMWNNGMVPSKQFNTPVEEKKINFFSTAYTTPTIKNKNDFNGTLFITTDDAEVIKQADKWGNENNWGIAYTTIFDRAIQEAARTYKEKIQKGGSHIHDPLEYLSMILNLDLSLKCEAWVCTLASNSCRIMDELRATVGAKANRWYADLSIRSCSEPPCYDGEHLFNWGE